MRAWLVAIVLALVGCEPLAGIERRPDCEVGSSRCAGLTGREICTEEGVRAEVCGSGTPVCVDGACQACAPGRVQCEAGAALRCSADGRTLLEERCPYFSASDEGRTKIAPGSRPTAECTPSGTCPRTCRPFETACSSDVELVRCSSDGATQTVESCVWCARGRCVNPKVTALAAGVGHTCALLAPDPILGTTKVHCWGSNVGGQFAVGATDLRPRPAPVAGSQGATKVVVGSSATCLAGLETNESEFLGSSRFPCLPRPYVVEKPSPERFVVRDVALTADAACWLRSTKPRMRCYGTGWPPDTDVIFDAGSSLTFGFVQRLVGGYGHICAQTTSKHWACFGHNDWGQAANLPAKFVTDPSVVEGSAGAELAVGGEHTCGIFPPGEVRCWGNNAAGQLGVPPTELASTRTPRPVVGLTGVVALGAGERHSCAVLSSGALVCWGANEAGQLGADAVGTTLPPQVVKGLDGVVGVAPGGRHTCALLRDGTVRCFGANDMGQLGTGDFDDRKTPSEVVW